MKIDALIASINKAYGKSTIGLASKLGFADIARFPSGSLFLDWALGGNKAGVCGWPLGRIVELFGPESAGKSLISLMAVAEAQRKGFDCLYIDTENTFDRAFASTVGVDVDKLILSRESEGEKIIDMACKLLSEASNLKVVVIDSLAAMIPQVEIEDPLEQAQMAPLARLMSKALRKLTASNKSNALIIFINQLREKPGVVYGNPEYTPGGRALKFYAGVRVDVRRGDWLFDPKDKKKKIGQVVKFKVVKNKTAIPLKEGYFKFMYNGEIDRVDELVSLGLLNKRIERKGAYFRLGGKQYMGREKLEMTLKADPKLFEEARKEVFK